MEVDKWDAVEHKCAFGLCMYVGSITLENGTSIEVRGFSRENTINRWCDILHKHGQDQLARLLRPL